MTEFDREAADRSRIEVFLDLVANTDGDNPIVQEAFGDDWEEARDGMARDAAEKIKADKLVVPEDLRERYAKATLELKLTPETPDE